MKEEKKPKYGPGSDSWEELKQRIQKNVEKQRAQTFSLLRRERKPKVIRLKLRSNDRE